MEEKNNLRENLEKGKNNKTLIIVLVVLGVILLIGIVFSIINKNTDSNKNNKNNNEVVDKDKEENNNDKTNEDIKDNNDDILEKYSVNNDEDFIKYLNKTSEALTKFNTYTVEYNKLKYISNKKEQGYVYDIYYDGKKIELNVDNTYNYVLETYLLKDDNNSSYLFQFYEMPTPQSPITYLFLINNNGKVEMVDKYHSSSNIEFIEQNKEFSYNVSNIYGDFSGSNDNEEFCKILEDKINDDLIFDYKDGNSIAYGNYKYKYQNEKLELIDKEETTIKDLKDKYNCN